MIGTIFISVLPANFTPTILLCSAEVGEFCDRFVKGDDGTFAADQRDFRIIVLAKNNGSERFQSGGAIFFDRHNFGGYKPGRGTSV